MLLAGCPSYPSLLTPLPQGEWGTEWLLSGSEGKVWRMLSSPASAFQRRVLMKKLGLLIGLIAPLVALAADKTPAPLPADKAAKGMVLPDGFHATVFAAEPDVVQPISFTIDARGRLWVAEALNYGTWKE